MREELVTRDQAPGKVIAKFVELRFQDLIVKSQQRLPKLVFGDAAILSPVGTMPRA
jgi:hypothetical protein